MSGGMSATELIDLLTAFRSQYGDARVHISDPDKFGPTFGIFNIARIEVDTNCNPRSFNIVRDWRKP